MRFKTFDLTCLTCKLHIRFKVRLPEGSTEKVSMVRRSWTDCPKCKQVRTIGMETGLGRVDVLEDDQPVLVLAVDDPRQNDTGPSDPVAPDKFDGIDKPTGPSTDQDLTVDDLKAERMR